MCSLWISYKLYLFACGREVVGPRLSCNDIEAILMCLVKHQEEEPSGLLF